MKLVFASPDTIESGGTPSCTIVGFTLRDSTPCDVAVGR
jgi:hypothetical protein